MMVEESRLAAIEGLADLGEREAVPVLLGLLEEVRLRPSVARSLGRLGGKRARLALRQALSGERYPAAREAEARALLALGDRASVATVREMLGNETSLPGGVAILRQFGDLGNPSARGAEIADPRVRGGDWQCDGLGCRPGSGARLRLPGVLPSSDGHLGVLEVHCGSSRCQFQVKGLAPQELGPGAGQVVFSLDVSSPLDWALGVKGDLKLRSIAVVPVRPDVPAPAPEPWQEGVPPGVPESGASGGDVDR